MTDIGEIMAHVLAPILLVAGVTTTELPAEETEAPHSLHMGIFCESPVEAAYLSEMLVHMSATPTEDILAQATDDGARCQMMTDLFGFKKPFSVFKRSDGKYVDIIQYRQRWFGKSSYSTRVRENPWDTPQAKRHDI